MGNRDSLGNLKRGPRNTGRTHGSTKWALRTEPPPWAGDIGTQLAIPGLASVGATDVLVDVDGVLEILGVSELTQGWGIRTLVHGFGLCQNRTRLGRCSGGDAFLLASQSFGLNFLTFWVILRRALSGVVSRADACLKAVSP